MVGLENIMLNKRSQSQKTTYHVILLYEMSRTGKSIETESAFGVAKGWGQR